MQFKGLPKQEFTQVSIIWRLWQTMKPTSMCEWLPIRKSMYPSPPDMTSMEVGLSGSAWSTVGESGTCVEAADRPPQPNDRKQFKDSLLQQWCAENVYKYKNKQRREIPID